MVHAESSSFQTIDNVNAYLEISTPALDLVDTVIIYTSKTFSEAMSIKEKYLLLTQSLHLRLLIF